MKKTTEQKIRTAYLKLNRLFVDEIMNNEFDVLDIDSRAVKIKTKSGYTFAFWIYMTRKEPVKSYILFGEDNFMPLKLKNLEGVSLNQHFKNILLDKRSNPAEVEKRLALYQDLKLEFETKNAD